MFPYDYIALSEWRLQQELEREAFLDPERAWLRLEHADPGLAPLIDGVVKGAGFLASLVGQTVRSAPALIGRRPARGHA
jgi:hypothetical protein